MRPGGSRNQNDTAVTCVMSRTRLKSRPKARPGNAEADPGSRPPTTPEGKKRADYTASFRFFGPLRSRDRVVVQRDLGLRQHPALHARAGLQGDGGLAEDD